VIPQFTVDASGIPDYLDRVKANVLAGIRGGMADAMKGLAYVVAGHAGGDPIVSRSGQFVGAVLGSPKVTQTDGYIKGTVSSMVGRKPMGVWFDEGTSVPAVQGVLYGFFSADGRSVFTHGHAAFQVAPHPIMNPSLREYQPAIIATIEARIDAAVGESA